LRGIKPYKDVITICMKITPPPDPAAGRTAAVTLISAPAGFGKTTLVLAPSCIALIRGIINVRIDGSIQSVAGKF
jgi:hypothetical protein